MYVCVYVGVCVCGCVRMWVCVFSMSFVVVVVYLAGYDVCVCVYQSADLISNRSHAYYNHVGIIVS